MCARTCASNGHKAVLDPLGLELQAFVNSLTWMWEPELWSSACKIVKQFQLLSNLSSYPGLILIRSCAQWHTPCREGEARAERQLSEVIKRQGEVVQDSSSVACLVYVKPWAPSPAPQKFGVVALSCIPSIWEEQFKVRLQINSPRVLGEREGKWWEE